uniref:G-protein coupled receptors family 1 profile domain-containing protein n=1 Tax=Romanomermis culicivorax TaxID=13658 RepID=A0A915L1Y9_ROMCU
MNSTDGNNVNMSLFTQTGFDGLVRSAASDSNENSSSNNATSENIFQKIIHNVIQYSVEYDLLNASGQEPIDDSRTIRVPDLHKNCSTTSIMPFVIDSAFFVTESSNFSDFTINHRLNLTTSDQQYNSKRLLFLIYGILIPLIAVPGILLNFASLIVLSRKSMRSSVNVYLAGLSFFDGFLLLVSLALFPPFSYCECRLAPDFWCHFLTLTGQITYPLSNILQTGSVWTVTAVTVDRFVAVVWPLKSRAYLTIGRATKVLAIIAIWSLFYNVPIMFELEKDNETLRATVLRQDTLYISVYKSYCYLFLMFLVPASLMIVLNAVVTFLIKKAYNLRRQMSGRDEKERRSTVMAVLVVGTFLVLNLMPNITNCIEAFDSKKSESVAPLIWTSNLLVTINSAINFFIYCALSLRFRQMFCKLFCPLCYTPEKEYKFLSAYFGTMRTADAATKRVVGDEDPGPREEEGAPFHRGIEAAGIISMRSLRRPLIKRNDEDNATTTKVGKSTMRPSEAVATSPPLIIERRHYVPPAYD